MHSIISTHHLPVIEPFLEILLIKFCDSSEDKMVKYTY